MTLLRRAFGFSPDSEEEDEDYDPTVPTYAAGTSASVSPQVPTAQSSPAGPKTNTAVTDSKSGAEKAPDVAASVSEGDTSLPSDLFDAVIGIFNEAQPDFVKKCLDTEAQRRYVMDSIDCKLRERAEKAMRSSAVRWEQEKTALEKRIAELEGDDNAMAVLRKENHRLQLSVDRQKRALLDRINDLEAQLAKQNEEKERFYSRRKPDSAMEEELRQAKSRVGELEAQLAALESAEAENKSAEAAAVESDAEAQQKIAELTAECEKLREEASRQSTLREQLEVKTAMSDKMINDLRSQAASARTELEKMQEEQEKVVEQIQKDLEGFEDLKARKDARIAELQESNTSLRRTIETNLYNQANSEMRLRKEVKELQAELDRVKKSAAESAGNGADAVAENPAAEAESARPAEKSASRRRGRPRKVRIDSDLDNTDWFSGGKHDDPDFGYHEPPRRPTNDNEAQLSLF